MVKNLIKKYTDLVAEVARDHEKVGASLKGHDFEHALMVANYAFRIAPDKHLAELGWIAGLCHNADHLVQQGFFRPDKKRGKKSDTLIRKKVNQYLSLTKLTDQDKHAVMEAVFEHHKKNDPHDSKLTMVLKDADRLANVGALHSMRSSRDMIHLPIVDYVHLFHHPEATYRKPGSAAKDIWYSLEWEPWLRLPKAKQLGKKRYKFLRMFLNDLESQLREAGLYPYPFPKKR
jgi:HD domain